MKMWRWILLAQLVVLPGLAMVLWLGSADQAVNEGPNHQPAVADEAQPIPPDPGELKQPVVVWTSKGSFDPMHVRNLDVMAGERAAVLERAKARRDALRRQAVHDIWRAFKLGDKGAMEEILRQEGRREGSVWKIVGVTLEGVVLQETDSPDLPLVVGAELLDAPVATDNGAAPMPFGRHTFGPWDTGRAVETR